MSRKTHFHVLSSESLSLLQSPASFFYIYFVFILSLFHLFSLSLHFPKVFISSVKVKTDQWSQRRSPVVSVLGARRMTVLLCSTPGEHCAAASPVVLEPFKAQW